MAGPTTPSPEEAAWMLSRPNDSKALNILVCSIICYVAATVFIALRLWSRRILRGRFRLDISDWLACMAWVSIHGFWSICCLLTRAGCLSSIYCCSCFDYAVWCRTPHCFRYKPANVWNC